MFAPTMIRISLALLLAGAVLAAPLAFAEYEEDAQYQEEREMINEGNVKRERKSKQWRREYYEGSVQGGSSAPPPGEKRKYFVPDSQRVDAGTFHVGFGIGGNFYTEPKFDNNNAPLGEYFKDFGFQGGVYFDFDYEDIRLGLRGWLGYKYVLRSVHAFGFEGRVRYLFPMSENVKFGVDIGVSGAIWIRTVTDTSLDEEVIFLPAFIVGAGFDFNPFMVDFKTLINRVGQDSTILGLELSFGFRL